MAYLLGLFCCYVPWSFVMVSVLLLYIVLPCYGFWFGSMGLGVAPRAPRPASNDGDIIVNSTLNIIERNTNGAPGRPLRARPRPSGGSAGRAVVAWPRVGRTAGRVVALQTG